MSDVLVVIGAGGMGEAVARRSGAGRRVLLADYDAGLLEDVSGRLQGTGFDVQTQQTDVSSRESMAHLAQTAAGMGLVTRVAHTAGLSPVQAPPDAILRVDLLGVAYCLEEFAKVVAPGGSGVVIASISTGLQPYDAETENAVRGASADDLLSVPYLQKNPGLTGMEAYAFSKRAAYLQVQGAAAAWGQRGARVNTISPGVISTPMGQEELAGPSGAAMRAMVQGSASKRLGTPSDIANAAEFLFGPDSTFITGTDLLVDGGLVASIVSGQASQTATSVIVSADEAEQE